MSIQLFKDHHTSAEEAFLPVLTAINMKWNTNSVELPNDTQVREVASYLGVNPEHLFVTDNEFLPYFYCHKHVWCDLDTMDLEQIKSMRVKERIQQLARLTSQLLGNNNFETAFFHIDKRLYFFSYQELFDTIPDDIKYDLFLDLYMQSEYGFRDLQPEALERIFSYRQFSKKKQSIRKKLKAITRSDGYITIYRGVGTLSTPIIEGYSWTTDIKIARFFANRFNDGLVYKGKVHISKVVDYITHRSESEVLVIPRNVMDIERL